MARLSLSTKEKRAISDILDQAEREYLTPLEQYRKIKKIDEQVKTVWPEWRTSSLSPPPQVSPGSPKISTPVSSPVSDNRSKRSPEALLEEVDSLKEEVHNLIAKIGKSVKSPRFSPKAERIASRIADPTSPSKKIVNPSVRENRYEANEVEAEDPQEISCSERQAKPIATERQMKILERDNQQLKQRLKELRHEYQESQKEISVLKTALKRSEAIQMKIYKRLRDQRPKKRASRWK
jgi:hypothetical protein